MNRAEFERFGEQIVIESPDSQMLAAALTRLGGPSFFNTYKKYLPAGFRRIIDVGASIGHYSILFSWVWPEAEIWAIEPSSVNFKYLEINTANIPNIRSFKTGAGEATYTHTIAIPTIRQKTWMNFGEGNSGVLSMFGDSDIYREEVPIVKLDDIVDKCDFIKIDTEGYEYKVIQGADRLLKEARPILHVEFMKCNLKMAGVEPKQLSDLILSYDYVPICTLAHDVVFVPAENTCSS